MGDPMAVSKSHAGFTNLVTAVLGTDVDFSMRF
jgi:hypothetical protein